MDEMKLLQIIYLPIQEEWCQNLSLNENDGAESSSPHVRVSYRGIHTYAGTFFAIQCRLLLMEDGQLKERGGEAQASMRAHIHDSQSVICKPQ